MNNVLLLKDAANFVRDKVSSNFLNVESYISTENLLPNKAGLKNALNLPPNIFKVPAYKCGDILISNIRPYLKKIWLSNKDGGCSADVLVLRAKDGIDPKFLYYALFRDDFFEHAMRGAKGTKMPRGDKAQILEFSIPKFSLEMQNLIASTMSVIDAKIECNNRINAQLESLARVLYDYWFLQFDFPDANGNPYKSSGGRMEFNNILKRDIPVGWDVVPLENYISLERGATYGKEDVCSPNAIESIGILRATNISGNIVDKNDLVYVPAKLLNQNQIIEKWSTLIVMSSGSKSHVGKNGLFYFDAPLGFGAFCSKITPTPSAKFFINTFLQSDWFKTYIKNQCLGTNINNLTNDHINNCPIIYVPNNVLDHFEFLVKNCYSMISKNYVENQELSQVRDWLLPILMNGQVTAS